MTDILNLIPYGKDNAITKEELMRITGLPERTIRKEIELLRKDHAIISSSHCKGYWRTRDIKELDIFIREVSHRAIQVLNSREGAQKELSEITGQNQQRLQGA
jgi:biotin operon repressor